VIGGLDKVGGWMAKQRLDGVIITCLMDEEKREGVARQLAEEGLRVSVWECGEKVLAEKPGGAAGEGRAQGGQV
jgi:hypothetical protein